jgi:hypothetical protein
MAHEAIFALAAAVDEEGPRVFLQESGGFLRSQSFHRGTPVSGWQSVGCRRTAAVIHGGPDNHRALPTGGRWQLETSI